MNCNVALVASCAFGLMALFSVPSARADQIVLDNGNSITGKVVDLTGDQVTLSSDFSEPIKIKKVHVLKIDTDNAAVVYLKGGR